jgi:hypothetical protein
LKDRFTWAQVKDEPALYQGVYVIWRGMLANISMGNNMTDFDLLVGYDTRNSLEGIARTHFASAVAANAERPFEVLGKVTVNGSTVSLEGVALHELR